MVCAAGVHTLMHGASQDVILGGVHRNGVLKGTEYPPKDRLHRFQNPHTGNKTKNITISYGPLWKQTKFARTKKIIVLSSCCYPWFLFLTFGHTSCLTDTVRSHALFFPPLNSEIWAVSDGFPLQLSHHSLSHCPHPNISRKRISPKSATVLQITERECIRKFQKSQINVSQRRGLFVLRW